MIESVWLLEYRYRERKNGKWSNWCPSEGSYVTISSAFRKFPAETIFNEEKYQRRAVEYVRKEPAE
jgi:hypothetical protein